MSKKQPTIQQILRSAAAEIQSVSTTPGFDAELLLAHILGKHRSFLLFHSNDTIPTDAHMQMLSAIDQRKKGVPVAYITGVQGFEQYDFFVDARVLIPRPETELLVEYAEAFVSQRADNAKRILDIGTGSGCIAITLALRVPDSTVTATDISAGAIEVAKKNAAHLDANITVLEGSLFEPVAGQTFDCIVSNPPYVNFTDVDEFSAESIALQHEPRIALTPKTTDPFETVRHIIQESPNYLSSSGALFIEIGADQGEYALHTAHKHFPNTHIEVRKDLAGKDRYLIVLLDRTAAQATDTTSS